MAIRQHSHVIGGSGMLCISLALSGMILVLGQHLQMSNMLLLALTQLDSGWYTQSFHEFFWRF
jgi:hypothetical protein